ncbi:MAG: capsular biosynthesis protein [Muribaculaceae bacterium]|nr:capsular biosynthesis protein [Muribaculaceae bacterium]
MWPFKSVDTLAKSQFLRGFTDWHSHILPGVDDGIRTMDESLATLDAFEQQGVMRVWLTPHIMEDFPNTTDRLRARFEDLKEAYKGPIELNLAAEHMLDSLFEERIKTKDVLPIGKDGEHLLIETSYVNPPYGMDQMVESVFAAGYQPILAHPERYRYMNEDDYLKWKERGVLFQMNFISLVGGYGETARNKAEWLLSHDLIDLTGSDVHRKFVFEHVIAKSPKRAKILEQLINVAQSPKIF